MAKRRLWLDYMSNLPQRALTAVAAILPHRLQLRLAGWVMRRVLGNLPKMRMRAKSNLSLIFPDLDAAARDTIQTAMATNLGRTMVEAFRMHEFHARSARDRVQGPGLAALKQAQKSGKGGIVITGHFGQMESIRAAMRREGMECGGIYRPYNNRFYDRDILRNLEIGGKPIFAKGRRGMLAMARHIARGGFVLIMFDQRMSGQPKLDFLGQPAATSTAAAELALKFEVPLVPAYGIRAGDGVSIDVLMEAPVLPSSALEMTQALNDSLSAQVRAHPEQYYWLHWRWGRPQKPS